jgi:hypothetical protein
MASEKPAIIEYESPKPPAVVDEPLPEVPFGVNEMRLTPGQWVVALVIAAVVLFLTPRVWKKAERFDTGVDYRMPYALSKDYWLYERRLQGLEDPSRVIVLGDSVVWGEYVRADGTLPHFLGAETGKSFVNAGVNGLFPLAMEGLVDYYGESIRNRKVIVHCNVLWLSSPERDLIAAKEQRFNHSRLVPQFSPWIPAYKADASERLSVKIEEHVQFSAWVGHLQNAYYGQRSIPEWTLEEEGSELPWMPNSWKAPWGPITMVVPGEPANDPERGPQSSRHRPWTEAGGGETTHFDWVPLESSLQWRALQRVIGTLRGRGNQVLVVVGPFNEHMIAPDQRGEFAKMREGIVGALKKDGVAVVAPEVLPSEEYADASHPLTQGYARLARQIGRDQAFIKWLGAGK